MDALYCFSDMQTTQRYGSLCNPLSASPIPRAQRTPDPTTEIIPVTCVGSLTSPGYYRKSKYDDWKPINQPTLDDEEDYDRSNVKLKKDNRKVLRLNLSHESDDDVSSSDDDEYNGCQSFRSDDSDGDGTDKSQGRPHGSDDEEGPGPEGQGREGEKQGRDDSRKLRKASSSSSSKSSSDEDYRKLPTKRDCASEDEVEDIWAITDDVISVANKSDEVLKISEDDTLAKGKTEQELRSEREDLLIFGRIRDVKQGTSEKKELKDRLPRGTKKIPTCRAQHSYNRQYTSNRNTNRKTQQKKRQPKHNAPTNKKGEHGDGRSSGRTDTGPSAENHCQEKETTPPPFRPIPACVHVSTNQNNNKPTTYADVCKRRPQITCHKGTNQLFNHPDTPVGKVSPIVTKPSQKQAKHKVKISPALQQPTMGAPSSSATVGMKPKESDVETKTRQADSAIGSSIDYHTVCDNATIITPANADCKADAISVSSSGTIETNADQTGPKLDDPAILCVSALPPCNPALHPFTQQEYSAFATAPPSMTSMTPPFVIPDNPYAYTNYVYSLLNQLSPQDLLMIIYELKIMEAMNMSASQNLMHHTTE